MVSTLAVDGWVLIFCTAKRDLCGCVSHAGCCSKLIVCCFLITADEHQAAVGTVETEAVSYKFCTE